MKPASLALIPIFAVCIACRQRDADTPPVANGDARPSRAAEDGAAPQAPIAVPDEDGDILSGVPRTIELPPADAPTPPMAEGADIVYACEDGSELRVTYAGGFANVTLPDARIVPLPPATLAAGESGEVFSGEALRLRRLGNVVELQQDEGPTRRCRESSGNA